MEYGKQLSGKNREAGNFSASACTDSPRSLKRWRDEDPDNRTVSFEQGEGCLLVTMRQKIKGNVYTYNQMISERFLEDAHKHIIDLAYKDMIDVFTRSIRKQLSTR